MSWKREVAWKNLDAANRSSVSFQLARYALALKYEALPQDVAHYAKRIVLDALGCAIGAYGEAPGRAVCEATVRDIGGSEQATLFGSGVRTSVLNATIVNTFLVRFLDYNDVGGGGHNSDTIPCILATAEREKASGKDFLTSVVVSYELGARVRDTTRAPTLEDNGWTPDIRGGMCIPPALGRLMGMDEEQIANAIGICASHSLPLGVLDAHDEENSMSKNLRMGFVCYDAVLACLLAKSGFTGPVRVIEGEAGIKQVLFRNEMNLNRLVDFAGWRILETRHKSLCANEVSTGHIATTISIVKEHDLKPEDIAAVKVTVPLREKLHTTYVAKRYPRNAESADHSIYYGNAMAIKERAFGPEQIRPEKFTDPVVLGLIEKITVEVDPTVPERGKQVAVEITTRDGRRFQKSLAVPHGIGNDPLTDAELETKFRDMAIKYMPERQIKRIFDTIWNLESVDDVAKLTALMVFPKRR